MDLVGLTLLAVLFIGRITFTRTFGMAEKGQCFSRFDYEEKLLEKVIRTDIRMQEVMERLETVMKTVKGTNMPSLETIESNTTNNPPNIPSAVMQFHGFTSCNTAKPDSSHRRELEEVKTKVERTSEETVEAVNDQWKDMAQQIESFQSILRSPTIAFNVRGATDKSPTAGQTIVFETIILNTGAAFDKYTGIFTSPVNGTFLFSVQVCSAFRQNGSFKLVADDVTLLSISNYNYISSFTSTSGSAVYQLRAGQRVWVQNEHDAGSSANLEDSDKERACWNQFSGVIIDLDLN